uniref:Uncharacterized protein n=1 Tax=Scophthalmus maximus TaxID=52904 RepID=A0A8D3BNJ8_SCOMX
MAHSWFSRRACCLRFSRTGLVSTSRPSHAAGKNQIQDQHVCIRAPHLGQLGGQTGRSTDKLCYLVVISQTEVSHCRCSDLTACKGHCNINVPTATVCVRD